MIPYQEQEEEAVIIHADRYVHEKVTNFEEEEKKRYQEKIIGGDGRTTINRLPPPSIRIVPSRHFHFRQKKK